MIINTIRLIIIIPLIVLLSTILIGLIIGLGYNFIVFIGMIFFSLVGAFCIIFMVLLIPYALKKRKENSGQN